MAFDFSELKGRVISKYGSQSAFAEAFGISETVFSQKMNNKVRFTSDDIVKITGMLEISSGEIGKYFFTPKVSKN